LPIWTDSKGLPFGVQIMARNFEEKAMFNFSQSILELQANSIHTLSKNN
jgi:Asp-tRNA(Asn)/Glu-tRNA(Gln) amidotransferase A subunit family amidase